MLGDCAYVVQMNCGLRFFIVIEIFGSTPYVPGQFFTLHFNTKSYLYTDG